MSARDAALASLGTPADEPDESADDVREELEHHLACAEDDLVRAGRTPEEACREARARFGDVEAIERTCRRIRMGRKELFHRLHWALTIVLLVALPLVAVVSVIASREARAQADRLRADAQALAERLREEARAHPEPVEHIVIGVGDVLRVQDAYNPGLRLTDKVAADGKFLLAEAGWVPAAGLTREQAERAFTEALARYYPEASVSVTVDPWVPPASGRDE